MNSLLILILLITFSIASCRPELSSLSLRTHQNKPQLAARNPNTNVCVSTRQILNGNSTLCFINKFRKNADAKKYCVRHGMSLMDFEVDVAYDPDRRNADPDTEVFKGWKQWVAPYFQRIEGPYFWVTQNFGKRNKCTAVNYKRTTFDVRVKDCELLFQFFCQFHF